jgi:transposase-like protein
MFYTDSIKARMVRRMVGPNAVSQNALAQETGIPQTTLSRWLRSTASFREMDEEQPDPPGIQRSITSVASLPRCSPLNSRTLAGLRDDPDVATAIQRFIEKHAAKSVVVTDRIAAPVRSAHASTRAGGGLNATARR